MYNIHSIIFGLSGQQSTMMRSRSFALIQKSIYTFFVLVLALLFHIVLALTTTTYWYQPPAKHCFESVSKDTDTKHTYCTRYFIYTYYAEEFQLEGGPVWMSDGTGKRVHVMTNSTLSELDPGWVSG